MAVKDGKCFLLLLLLLLVLLHLFKRQLLDEKNSHGSEGRKSIKIAPKNSLM